MKADAGSHRSGAGAPAGNGTDPAGNGEHPAAQHRRRSVEQWEEAASGWVRRQDAIRELGAPVSHWMVQALELRHGQRVLELAAGLGETGLLAAELVAPTGGVILSDHAEAMLEGARARAGKLDLTNVEFQVWNAEWIDLPVASVDAVLCRWGYMLMADPLAALTETRRVLRPGGRVALAVWDSLAANPWALVPRQELLERGLAPASEPPPRPSGGGAEPGDGAPIEYTPGPFGLGDPERLHALLGEAGFTEIVVEAIEVVQRHHSFAAFWETMLDLSRELHDLVLAQPATEIEAIEASLAGRLAPHTAPDGTLEIPGRSLVAVAFA